MPALLNKMLAALAVVATKEIDYSCTDAALQAIQIEGNHLREFCYEVGLKEQSNGRVYIGELWERLSQWYIDNGIAEIIVVTKGKEKKEKLDFICESSRRNDKYVKGSRFVAERF